MKDSKDLIQISTGLLIDSSSFFKVGV